jgi:hypothetical protein
MQMGALDVQPDIVGLPKWYQLDEFVIDKFRSLIVYFCQTAAQLVPTGMSTWRLWFEVD